MKNNTVLGEALKKAAENKVLTGNLKKVVESKKHDFSSFEWKGEKVKVGDRYVQKIEKIGEMDPDRLKECWEHCEKMLYNEDSKFLGRYNVLEEVNEQINKCNVELFFRYLENSYLHKENSQSIPRFKMMIAIRDFIKNSEKDAKEQGISLDWNSISVSHLNAAEFPSEFQDITISDALDGSTDNLGSFNKQHLTMTFITKMGVWFTKQEENEIKVNSNAERLKTVKDKLHLPTKLNLRFSDKGLSFHEMRAMLILPKKQKYSDMTTEQLVTLRNKVLPRLLKEIDSHIFNWERLQKQIEIVARSKGINLHND